MTTMENYAEISKQEKKMENKWGNKIPSIVNGPQKALHTCTLSHLIVSSKRLLYES